MDFAQLPSGDIQVMFIQNTKCPLNYLINFQMLTFVCFTISDTKPFQWYAVGLLISSIFLVATLLIYGFNPKVFVYIY